MSVEWTEVEGNGVVRNVSLTDDIMVERLEQDAEPFLEHNKKLQTHNDGYSPSREVRHVASVPMGVVLMWQQKHGIDVFNPNHADAVKRLLNDPEYRWLRTSEGKL